MFTVNPFHLSLPASCMTKPPQGFSDSLRHPSTVATSTLLTMGRQKSRADEGVKKVLLEVLLKVYTNDWYIVCV